MGTGEEGRIQIVPQPNTFLEPLMALESGEELPLKGVCRLHRWLLSIQERRMI